nr:RNA-directed DNA polymerase, eukaryota [Tanacetum cinerariifolium]
MEKEVSVAAKLGSVSIDVSFRREVSVAAKLGSVSIDVSFRRGVRGGGERQQWDDLQSLMQSVFLSSSGDRWICDLSGDGEYRVKEDFSLVGFGWAELDVIFGLANVVSFHSASL